jgi:hypothetical protein
MQAWCINSNSSVIQAAFAISYKLLLDLFRIKSLEVLHACDPPTWCCAGPLSCKG